MDDNKGKQSKNQSGPFYESIPVDNAPEPFQPEEVAADILSPEDAFTSAPPEIVDDLPPLYEEKKSPVLIIVLSLIFFLTLIGLGGWFVMSKANSNGENVANSGKPKDVVLVYWGLWEDKSVYEPLIEEYQKKNPHVTIEYEKMNSKDYLQKLIARTKNKQGPDIFRYHNTWLPQLKEVAAPLSEEVVSKKEFEETFYPIVHKDLALNGEYYGLPLMIDGIMMIYNDKILKSAGVFVPPSNWLSDMMDSVSKVTVLDKDENIVTAGIAMGTTSNVEFFAELYAIILYQNGGDLSELDSKTAEEALQFYTEMVDNKFWDESMPNSITAFIEERVPIIFGPSWVVAQVKASNPDLEVKTATMPKALNDKELSIASYWVEGVTKTSSSQVEAWKFLRFLSSKDSLEKMYETQVQTRLFGAPYPRVDMADEMLNNEYIAPIIEQARADSYISLPLASRTGDQAMNDEIIEYLQSAIDRALQGSAYGSALEPAAEGINQVLDRNDIELKKSDD